MKFRRFWQAWLVIVGLTLTAVATVYTASAPTGPSITVYRSPT